MIRIEKGREVRPGALAYRVPSLGISGASRQPLSDACRQIKSILGDTSQLAGIFRAGREEPDIFCRVDKGAELTVEDDATGIRSRKFRAFAGIVPIAEAAE